MWIQEVQSVFQTRYDLVYEGLENYDRLRCKFLFDDIDHFVTIRYDTIRVAILLI
jgi:hypothetical protein